MASTSRAAAQPRWVCDVSFLDDDDDDDQHHHDTRTVPEPPNPLMNLSVSDLQGLLEIIKGGWQPPSSDLMNKRPGGDRLSNAKRRDQVRSRKNVTVKKSGGLLNPPMKMPQQPTPKQGSNSSSASSSTTTAATTFRPQKFTEADLTDMGQIIFGTRILPSEMSRYHLLVIKVVLLCERCLAVEQVVKAVQQKKRITGAVGFTAHRSANSHFFSIVLDFENPPSYGAGCYNSNAQEIKFGDSTRCVDLVDRLAALRDEESADWCSGGFYHPQPNKQLGRTVIGAPRILAVYPSVDCSVSESAKVGDGEFWISWNFDLPALSLKASDPLELSYVDGSRVTHAQGIIPPEQTIVRNWLPFCCGNIVKMHHRRLRRDAIFQALVAHRGSQPDIVYEVKTMKLSGVVYDRCFYRLEDGEVKALPPDQMFFTKIHAFKNYYCTAHKYWFSVDLFKSEEDSTDDDDEDQDETASTLPSEASRVAMQGSVAAASDEEDEAGRPLAHRHRMRMSPFTHIDNWTFIEHFFSAMGFPDLS